MGVKRLGNRGRPKIRLAAKPAVALAEAGKLMVKQGGFGFAEPVMVPSPRAPLRMSRKRLRS